MSFFFTYILYFSLLLFITSSLQLPFFLFHLSSLTIPLISMKMSFLSFNFYSSLTIFPSTSLFLSTRLFFPPFSSSSHVELTGMKDPLLIGCWLFLTCTCSLWGSIWPIFLSLHVRVHGSFVKVASSQLKALSSLIESETNVIRTSKHHGRDLLFFPTVLLILRCFPSFLLHQEDCSKYKATEKKRKIWWKNWKI